MSLLTIGHHSVLAVYARMHIFLHLKEKAHVSCRQFADTAETLMREREIFVLLPAVCEQILQKDIAGVNVTFGSGGGNISDWKTAVSMTAFDIMLACEPETGCLEVIALEI